MSTTISDIEFANQCADAIRKTFNQNARCVDEDQACVYNGPNGLRCLVGHMMTDDELEKFGNAQATVRGLINNCRWREGQYSQQQIRVLEYLQDAHDNKTAPSDFRGAFLRHLRRLVPKIRLDIGLSKEAWIIFGDTLESLEQQMMEGNPA